MSAEKSVPNRIFIDTLFVIALINRRDQYHQQALDLGATFAVARQMPMEHGRCAKLWPQLGMTRRGSVAYFAQRVGDVPPDTHKNNLLGKMCPP
jgi:hypothetical protein